MPLAEVTQGWKVLVVDDEPEVHTVTRLVLDSLEFEGRRLELLDAHSGTQARELMVQHPDIALILLDVVMESDTAGLDFVEYVRGTLGDRTVRIVLRTGHPGCAPEYEISRRYEVNDYRNKTELTFHSLSGAVHRALSAYRDLRQLGANQQRLEQIIQAWCGQVEDMVRRIHALQKAHEGASHPSPSVTPPG